MESSAFLHALSAELAEFTKKAARPGVRLLSRGRLSPVRISGVGVAGEEGTKVESAAGSISVLPPIEGNHSGKCKEVEAMERPEVHLLALGSATGAAVARRQSETAQVHRPDSSLRFPCLQSTGQERATVQPGREEARSWGKSDGEEMSRRPPRAVKGKTPTPWLETPQPDLRPPRARQVLADLQVYRSREDQWKRNAELNRLRATAPKQFLCTAQKMEVHDLREKLKASPSARGMCAHYVPVAPRRPAPRR